MILRTKLKMSVVTASGILLSTHIAFGLDNALTVGKEMGPRLNIQDCGQKEPYLKTFDIVEIENRGQSSNLDTTVFAQPYQRIHSGGQ